MNNFIKAIGEIVSETKAPTVEQWKHTIKTIFYFAVSVISMGLLFNACNKYPL